MDGQSLALEPIARNLQRISPVRMFHLAVEITPGVPGRVFGFVETAESRGAETLLSSIEKAVGQCTPAEGASFDDRAAELISAMNRGAAEARRSGKAPAATGDIAALAAVTSGVQVAISGRNATALRIHRDGKNLDSSELLPSADSAGEALFRSLVIGGLGGRDALFLSGRRIFDYIARDHLSRIVANAEPEAARETILSALADISQSFSLAAFLVKPATARPRASMPDITSPSIDSLDEFLNKATNTERMLNPSLQFPAIGAVRRLFGARREGPAPAGLPRQGGAVSRWQRGLLERCGDLFKLLAAAARGAVLAAASGSRRLARIAVNREGSRSKEMSALRQGVTSRVERSRTRLFGLPFPARIALVSAVAAGLVFAASVIVLGRSRSKNDNLAAYNTALAAVGDKRDAIEASAIYSDSSRAWTLVDEARALVAVLPTDTQRRREEVDRLAGLLEEDARKLRRETLTDNPVLVYDLATVKPGARGGALVLAPDAFFIAEAAGGSLIRVPRSGGSPAVVSDLPSAGSVAASTWGSRGLFLTDAPALISIEKNKTSAISSDFGGRPAGIAVWNDRLYSLNPADSSITRHNRSGNGYGPGAPWVKSGGDELRDGRSIAIDGSVYVGTSTGKILKYHLGAPADFIPGRLEPDLKSIARLAAPPDGAFLYILVPETKRVVVLVKETGALVAQYTSPKFDALSDMAVDESAKILYLLNGSAIYSVPLAHLQ